MANLNSSIEWTDATWSPTTGCDRVSAGCDNCYAMALAARLKAMGKPHYQIDGDPKTSGPGFGLTMHPDRLEIPLHWTKPRRIFVDSMSDLFHADVPEWFIASVFAVMLAAPQHTFQILTKRPQRMYRLISDPQRLMGHLPDSMFMTVMEAIWKRNGTRGNPATLPDAWPLPNVWLGTSVENQEAAYRIDWLVKTPASVRFLSIEPMIGPVTLRKWVPPSREGWAPSPIHWCITGGESGPSHRPFDPAWAADIRDECLAAGVAYFHKQGGGRTPKSSGRLLDGREWNQFPDGKGGIIDTDRDILYHHGDKESHAIGANDADKRPREAEGTAAGAVTALSGEARR